MSVSTSPDGARVARPRLRGLDYARGVAALLVLVLHFGEFMRARAELPSWHAFGDLCKLLTAEWIDFGKIGIAAFFCVSGAIIPSSLPLQAESRAARTAALQRFAVARLFRLYPMYWASLLLAVLLGWAEVSGAALWVNATMLQRFVGVRDALGVYWTLQIELIFYGLCALLFALGRLHEPRVQDWAWRTMLGLGVLTAAARYATGIKLPAALFMALMLMFFCCRHRRAIVAQRDAQGERPRPRDYLLLVAGIFVICRLAYSRDYGFGETWYRYFFSYLIGIALFQLLARAHDLAFGRALALLGEASYALYLLHPVVGFLVLDAFRRAGGDPWLAFALATVSSLLTSYLAYRLIEAPAISFGRRVVKRLRSVEQPAAVDQTARVS